MYKRGYAPLIWGGLLIILGFLLLAENLGWLGGLNAPFWSLILGAVGLVFLGTFASDREKWWALIPGLVLLGVALAVFLAEQDLVAGHVVATLILAAVGLPFLLIFLIDRQHTWALIPALTMAGIALGVLLEGAGAISGSAMAGFVLGGIGLGFLSIYVIDREQWWALIPGGIMGLMAAFFLMAAAAKLIVPLAIILFGLLLLSGALRRGRRQPQVWEPPSVPHPPVHEPESGERKRFATLEEQIQAAISEESEEDNEPSGPEGTVWPNDMPSAPDVPKPPDIPPAPDMPD